jgi:hypothetical protein
MATIKLYTDIEQSKKLAGILPLESADMHYGNFSPKGLGYENKFSAGLTPYIKEIKVYEELKESYKIKDYNGIVAWRVIPCWSLAALISIIPQEIFDGEYIINITEGLDNRWVLTYDHFENRNHSYYGLSSGADNLVDACVDIIIKLKERNII